MSGFRIALLSACYWPEVRRGGERVIRELADGLIERGHSPRLITSHPRPPTRSVEDGLEVTRDWRPPDGRFRRRGHEPYLTAMPFTYASLLRGEDQLAHAFHLPDAAVGARWKQRTGGPLVFTHLGIPDRRDLVYRRRRARMAERVAASADAFTVVSQAAAAAAARSLGVEARVVYPGVNLESFSPAAAERSERPTIFFPGAREEPRKGAQLLREALPLVRREVPEVELLTADPHATDMASLYRRSWVSALPAMDEALGLVLAESLACGVPAVGLRHGGVPEVIDSPAVGRLAEPGDSAGLAQALIEALELSRDPSTAAACRASGERFASERQTESYLAIYEELLAAA